ncbi:MAG: hypothetical protein ABJO67_05575 [Pseudoruegeria sp.]
MRDAIAKYGQCDGVKTKDGMLKRYNGLEPAFRPMQSIGPLKTRKQLKSGSLREKAELSCMSALPENLYLRGKRIDWS